MGDEARLPTVVEWWGDVYLYGVLDPARSSWPALSTVWHRKSQQKHESRLPVRCMVSASRNGGKPQDRIDEQMQTLARIAAAIAIGATAPTLAPLVDDGHASGVSDEEILGTLLAVAPIIGSVRLVRAAPELARAIGYDIDKAFEEPP